MSARRRGLREHLRPAQWDYPGLYARAFAVLADAYARCGALSPRANAAVVATTLPPALRRRVWHTLERRGWLAPTAHVPSDVLDGARGPAREIVRLALFGLPGQGRATPGETKHREAIFQQLCSQIVRESVDLKTLSSAGQRAFAHPDAMSDATLANQLRSFIASREAELHVQDATQHPTSDDSQLRSGFMDQAPRKDELPEVIMMLDRARLEFVDAAHHYDELGAKAALQRIRSVTIRHAEQLNETTWRQCERGFAQLVERCNVFRQQMEELVAQAVAAAHRGDTVTTAWALRRLAAINALRPALLPDTHYSEVRQRIENSGARVEHREAARQLLGRERAVASQIRQLAEIIRQFQEVANRVPHSDPTYLRAEDEFRTAAARIRSLDTDWLAGLVIELTALVEELGDHGSQAEHQVDQFIASVRDTLLRLRKEIAAARPAGPPLPAHAPERRSSAPPMS